VRGNSAAHVQKGPGRGRGAKKGKEKGKSGSIPSDKFTLSWEEGDKREMCLVPPFFPSKKLRGDTRVHPSYEKERKTERKAFACPGPCFGKKKHGSRGRGEPRQ